jgi:hypothetical protein
MSENAMHTLSLHCSLHFLLFSRKLGFPLVEFGLPTKQVISSGI